MIKQFSISIHILYMEWTRADKQGMEAMRVK